MDEADKQADLADALPGDELPVDGADVSSSSSEPYIDEEDE